MARRLPARQEIRYILSLDKLTLHRLVVRIAKIGSSPHLSRKFVLCTPSSNVFMGVTILSSWLTKKRAEGNFAMELLITLGRDSVVACQNAASPKLKALRLGESIIRNTFALPGKEIRDSIFSGKTISFWDRSLFLSGREILLTRDYRPLQGPDGEVVGIISMGSSRQAPGAQEYSDLSALISALGSPELPNQLSASAPLAGSSHGEPSGSQALARRLRRFLPRQVH
jgi:hypothetical protein